MPRSSPFDVAVAAALFCFSMGSIYNTAKLSKRSEDDDDEMPNHLLDLKRSRRQIEFNNNVQDSHSTTTSHKCHSRHNRHKTSTCGGESSDSSDNTVQSQLFFSMTLSGCWSALESLFTKKSSHSCDHNNFDFSKFLELTHWILLKDRSVTALSIVARLDAKDLKPKIFVAAIPPMPGTAAVRYDAYASGNLGIDALVSKHLSKSSKKSSEPFECSRDSKYSKYSKYGKNRKYSAPEMKNDCVYDFGAQCGARDEIGAREEKALESTMMPNDACVPWTHWFIARSYESGLDELLRLVVTHHGTKSELERWNACAAGASGGCDISQERWMQLLERNERCLKKKYCGFQVIVDEIEFDAHNCIES